MALHHVRIGAMRKQARSNGLPWGNAKLTQKQVLSILKRGKSGRESQQQIADSVGCSQVNIGYILSGKTWKHLHEAS